MSDIDLSTFGIQINTQVDRFSIYQMRIEPEEDGDPGFIVYTLTPEEAASLVVRLWSMLPLEYRPVPRIP